MRAPKKTVTAARSVVGGRIARNSMLRRRNENSRFVPPAPPLPPPPSVSSDKDK